MTARRFASSVVCLLVVALALVGCSSGAGASGGTLTVTGAWVRVPTSPDTTAAYLTITNGTASDDTLVGVSTAAATSATLHETTTASGMTGMHMTPEIRVPAGGTVSLAPGGYHVMLMGLTGELKAGASVEIVLTFEHAGVVKVLAEVRAG